MISYGVKTWKTAAFPAMLFLILAVYLWTSAIYQHSEVRSEQKDAVRLLVTVEKEADLSALLGLKDIYRGTPVYETIATVTSGIYSAELTVRGMDAAMVPGNLIEGELYPDTSGMPWLLLNEAALNSLVAGTPVLPEQVSWMNNETRIDTLQAKTCGIVKDGEEASVVYTSVEAVKYMMEEKGEIPTMSYALLELKDAGYAEKVQQKLTELGFSSNLDEQKVMEWTIQKEKIRCRVFSGGIALLSGICMLFCRTKYVDNMEEIFSFKVQFARCLTVTLLSFVIGIVMEILTIIWNLPAS